mgnify:FL=1|tara:strand:- start:219 stop:551 length:333 start_codon:yes stop_codon:yes gene_type:complete
MDNFFLECLKIFVAVSIFYVWVPRYFNIVEEFKQYKYPDQLRDIVGILKLTFAFMLVANDGQYVVLASGGLIILMSAAFITHLRVKNNYKLFFPSMSQIIMNSYILYMTY